MASERDLIHRYFSDLLDEAEMRELDDLLVSHEDARQLFVEMSMDNALISETARGHAELEEAEKQAGAPSARMRAAERVRGSSRRLRPARQRPSTRMWGLWVAAAACLMIVAGAHYVNRQQQSAAKYIIIASITSASGDVRIERDGSLAPAGAGARVAADDKVITGDGASVTVSYPGESTEMSLPGGVEATFGLDGKAKRIDVDGPSLQGRVAPQPQGLAMVIRKGDAEVTVGEGVVTADFRLTDADGGRFEVTRGSAALKRLSDGETIEVTGGSYVLMTGGGAFALRRIGDDAFDIPEAPLRLVEKDDEPEEAIPPDDVAHKSPVETPDQPEPELVEIDRPEPSPETAPETEVHVARLGKVSGLVKCRRGGGAKWFKASSGVTLMSGDEIDSRATVVSFIYEGGSKVVLNKSTWIAVEANAVVMRGKSGEVYCEVADGAKGKFAVVTEHVRITDLGTRFGVDVGVRGTAVTVAEGSVEVKKQETQVVVAEGEQSVTSASATKPGKPREVDADEILAWALASDVGPGQRSLFSDDFDRSPVGQWPKGWRKHQTQPQLRSSFEVAAEAGLPGVRFMRARAGNSGATQHALIPVRTWPASFDVTFRMRLDGTRNSRAGIEIEDGKNYIGFECRSGASVVSVVHRALSGERQLGQGRAKLEAGKWQMWHLSVRGRLCRLSVDGKDVIDIEVKDFGAVTAVSLASRGADSAKFDDVRVIAATGR